jgi:hypothetical protein
MAGVAMLIMGVGWLIAVIGSIMVLIEAFKTSILWGIGSLLIGIVGLVFVIMHWDVAKRGFLISLAGVGVAIVGGVLGGAFGAPA